MSLNDENDNLFHIKFKSVNLLVFLFGNITTKFGTENELSRKFNLYCKTLIDLVKIHSPFKEEIILKMINDFN